MLVAKINPPAKKIFQTTPFNEETMYAENMIAKCTQLVIGGKAGTLNDEIKFEIRFGNMVREKNPDGTDGNLIFQTLINSRVTFTQSELSSWGTDDTVVYSLIAQKLGFDILSTEQVDMTFTL